MGLVLLLSESIQVYDDDQVYYAFKVSRGCEVLSQSRPAAC